MRQRKTRTKSQVTIFMIIGVILILSMVFFYYVSSAVQEETSKVGVEQTIENFLQATAFKQYVKGCLDRSLKEAVKTVGLQGGYIYNTQIPGCSAYYGPSPLSGNSQPYGFSVLPMIQYGSFYNVSFVVMMENPSITFPGRPVNDTYPYEGNLLSYPPISDRQPLGKFGNTDHPFPGLCNNSPESLNYYNMTGGEYSCEKESYEEIGTYRTSIQDMIRMFVENRTKECVDFDSFIYMTPYNVSEGDVNARILIGETNVYAEITYPIYINIAEYDPLTKKTVLAEPRTEMMTFQSTAQIRLKKAYELAHHMLAEDAYNIFFDKRQKSDLEAMKDCMTFEHATGKRELFGPCLYEGINITFINDTCRQYRECMATPAQSGCPSQMPANNDLLDCMLSANYSDIVVINDTESLIDGETFLFVFAVQNRHPALDFIDESVSLTTPYNTYLTNIRGTTILKAYNKTSQNNSAQDYNIVVDFDPSSQSMLEIFPYAMDPDEDNIVYRYEGWKTNIPISSSTGVSYQDPIDGKNDIVSAKNEIEDNYIVGGDGSQVRIGINRSDVGYHWIRVKALDDEGLYDWQDVKIQVRCNDTGPGDCCNATSYHWNAGELCGTCQKCSEYGVCGYSEDATQNCGICEECGLDNNIPQCIGVSMPEDPDGRCENHQSGNECCSGSCVNLQTDDSNCGSCDFSCKSARVNNPNSHLTGECANGLCQCERGYTLVDSDPKDRCV